MMQHAARVLMYTTLHCPYCGQAERLLLNKGVTDVEKVRVDLSPERRAEMMHRTGRRSVPQIYIGERHVGGYRELNDLNRSGELDSLLAAKAT